MSKFRGIRWAWTCCFLCFLFLFASAANAGENLLENGDFHNVNDGWPVGWYEDKYLTDFGVTYMEMTEDGPEGKPCAYIESVMRNDARFAQDVQVEPNTVYRLSALVRAEGMDKQWAGANLSVLACYEVFPSLHDTGGEFVPTACYFRTAEGQKSASIALRVGGYSSDNLGKAWFADVALEKVDVVPPGIAPIQLTTVGSNSGSNFATLEGEGDVEVRQGGKLIWLVPAFLLLLLLAWRFAKPEHALAPEKRNWNLLLFVLLGMAAVLRIIIAMKVHGYEVDINCFFSWSNRMLEVGPAQFYVTDTFCDYPPGYLYVLWLNGLVMRLLGIKSVTPVALLVLKFVPIATDLVAAYVLYRVARKALPQGVAMGLMVLYALNPAVLVSGAAWGQVDSVLALGIMIAMLYAARGDWLRALPVYFLAVLIKPQALMLGPIGLVALVLDLWARRKEKGVFARAGMGLGISAGISLLIIVPFTFHKGFAWVIGLYTNTLASYPYATLNTPNLFYLFGGNWANLTQKLGFLTFGQWGILLMGLVILYCLFAYWRGKRRENLYLISAALLLGLFVFGVKMHERYLFPALILLLLAYVADRDWRLLLLFAGFSLTGFVNIWIVLRYEHMIGDQQTLGMVLSTINVLLCLVLFWAVWDIGVRRHILHLRVPRAASIQEEDAQLAARMALPQTPKLSMKRIDWVLMLSLTAMYAVVAYVGLGSTVAPQTAWTSTGQSEQVTFDLGASRDFTVMYYGGISSRAFSIATSEDGVLWSESKPAQFGPGECFRWKYQMYPVVSEDGAVTGWTTEKVIHIGRYVRLTADGPGLVLHEVVFRGVDEKPIPVLSATSMGGRQGSLSDPMLLVDEQTTMPDLPGYYNGTYFDEIYHARTGYEHLHGLAPLEYTHPPLGKVFIMWAIQLFGMTPFGWRFAGALMGVLMVPAMYLLAKALFRKWQFAFLAAFMIALDCMHLTQTRIATIDSYAVLFIMLMYLCMYRYLQMSYYRDKLGRTLVPLALSGLFMGLGIASKWIAIYAAGGLAVLLFWGIGRRMQEYFFARHRLRAEDEPDRERYEAVVRKFVPYTILTLLWCVLFFIIIPLGIYIVSYIPHITATGPFTLQRVWDVQVSMFNYHATLIDDHSFKSRWYEWPLMLKPMWFFKNDLLPYEKVSSILTFGNPAVWWAGFVALLWCTWRWVGNAMRLRKPRVEQEAGDDLSLPMILIGFVSQLLPWVFVTRSTFIYHYFASVPFIILCVVYAVRHMSIAWSPKKTTWMACGYMAVVLILFVAFYPLATGTIVPRAWAESLNWFKNLRLPGWRFSGWMYF